MKHLKFILFCLVTIFAVFICLVVKNVVNSLLLNHLFSIIYYSFLFYCSYLACVIYLLSIQSQYHVLMAAKLSVVNVACHVCMTCVFLLILFILCMWLCVCLLMFPQVEQLHAFFFYLTCFFHLYLLCVWYSWPGSCRENYEFQPHKNIQSLEYRIYIQNISLSWLIWIKWKSFLVLSNFLLLTWSCL